MLLCPQKPRAFLCGCGRAWGRGRAILGMKASLKAKRQFFSPSFGKEKNSRLEKGALKLILLVISSLISLITSCFNDLKNGSRRAIKETPKWV